MLPPSAPPPPLPPPTSERAGVQLGGEGKDAAVEGKDGVVEGKDGAVETGFDSPQSPPQGGNGHSWVADETMFVDLSKTEQRGRRLTGGPGYGITDKAHEILQEKQKNARNALKAKPVLKRFSLEGLRQKETTVRGSDLSVYSGIPFKVTRTKMRVLAAFQGELSSRRFSESASMPNVKGTFRCRLDYQPCDTRRVPEPAPRTASDADTTVDLHSRTLPPGGRHLVVWGTDQSLLRTDGRPKTASIEAVIESLMQAKEYRSVFGQGGPVECHASSTLERRDPPWPLRVLGRGSSNARINGCSVCEYRSMFSSMQELYRGEWVWSVSDSSLRPPFRRPLHSYWSGILEFSHERACTNFFEATTYCNVDFNNLSTLPDYMGIKYWLHTVLSAGLAPAPLRTPTAPASPVNAAKWWDPQSTYIWAPFLLPSDVKHALWSSAEPDRPDSFVRPSTLIGGGFEISASLLRLAAVKDQENKCVAVLTPADPKIWLSDNARGALENSVLEKNAVDKGSLEKGSADKASLEKGVLELPTLHPAQVPLIRIPKYIMSALKNVTSARARVGLLLFPTSPNKRLLATPVILCSTAQFLNADPVHVLIHPNDRTSLDNARAMPTDKRPSSSIPSTKVRRET